MKFIYLFLSFLTLIFFDYYLKTNISGMGEGSLGVSVLLLFVIFSVILFLWRLKVSKSVSVRHSVLWVLLFFAYFVFRIGEDIGSIEQLKSYTIGTSGGIVLFYALGSLVAMVLGQNFYFSACSKSHFRFYMLFIVIYFSISFLLLTSIYFELATRLRTDLFLIADIDGAYQRPGVFLTICYLVMVTLYAQFIALKQYYRMMSIGVVNILLIIILLGYTLLSVVIAQMIGSNNATVMIACLSMIVISVDILLRFVKVKRHLCFKPLCFYQLIFGKISARVVLTFVFGLFLLLMVLFGAVSFLGLDLSITRIGGFGVHEVPSSVTSRLNLLDDFTILFSYSPIFGNMNVDCLTVGCGKYVHSFVASALTHTGIIGTFLLAVYFIMAYRVRFNMSFILSSQNDTLVSNIYNLFSILFISAVLLIAIVGTFLSWAVIWFSMGLYFIAFNFHISHKV